jgi:outer membrane protein insertion porin family
MVFKRATLCFTSLLLCLITISALSSTTRAQNSYRTELNPMDSGELVSVRFIGNDSIPSDELQSIIGTRVASGLEKFEYFLSFGSIGLPTQFTDQPTIEHDSVTIIQYYRTHGFLLTQVGTRVTTDSTAFAEADRLARFNRTAPRAARKVVPRVKDTVTFLIRQGKPSYVEYVSLSGLENIPNEFQSELTDSNLIRRGSRYSLKTVSDQIDRLTLIMEEHGYPYFRRDSIFVERNPVTNKVRVIITFNTGHRYRYGPIRIVYDSTSREQSRISESVIRAMLVIDTGAWYKMSDVRKSEQYLYRLNALEIAHVSLDTSALSNISDTAKDGMEVPVIVALRMATSKTITPGIFAGTGIQGFTTGFSFGYSNRNIFRGAQSFNTEASYQLLPSTQSRYGITTDLTFPYIGFGRIPLTMGASFSIAKQFDHDVANNKDTLRFDERLISGRVGSNIVLGDPLLRTTVTPEITGELVHRNFADSVLRVNNQGKSLLNQINTIFSTSFLMDRTNDLFSPTGGYYFSALGELGTSLFKFLAGADFGSATYKKFILQFKQFFDFGSGGNFVVGYRVRAGDAFLDNPGTVDHPIPDPLSDLPLERRFYGGGPSSIRGWPSQALLVAPHGDDGRTTQDGGYRLFEANFEVRIAPFRYPVEVTTAQKLLSPMRVVLFFDAGQVWDNFVPITANQLALAIGAGIRYLTLIGPFRFDVGIKLRDPNPNWGVGVGQTLKPAYPDTPSQWIFNRKFNFDALTFQFTIGQAF